MAKSFEEEMRRVIKTSELYDSFGDDPNGTDPRFCEIARKADQEIERLTKIEKAFNTQVGIDLDAITECVRLRALDKAKQELIDHLDSGKQSGHSVLRQRIWELEK